MVPTFTREAKHIHCGRTVVIIKRVRSHNHNSRIVDNKHRFFRTRIRSARKAAIPIWLDIMGPLLWSEWRNSVFFVKKKLLLLHGYDLPCRGYHIQLRPLRSLTILQPSDNDTGQVTRYLTPICYNVLHRWSIRNTLSFRRCIGNVWKRYNASSYRENHTRSQFTTQSTMSSRLITFFQVWTVVYIGTISASI